MVAAAVGGAGAPPAPPVDPPLITEEYVEALGDEELALVINKFKRFHDNHKYFNFNVIFVLVYLLSFRLFHSLLRPLPAWPLGCHVPIKIFAF